MNGANGASGPSALKLVGVEFKAEVVSVTDLNLNMEDIIAIIMARQLTNQETVHKLNVSKNMN